MAAVRQRQNGFTLVEIMIVVSVIALLAAIAVPAFVRARKRAQAGTVKNELRLIDDAVQQYAIESYTPAGTALSFAVLQRFFKSPSRLHDTGRDILGNDYGNQEVDNLPEVPQLTCIELSDVVDAAFWSPYQCAQGDGEEGDEGDGDG